MQLLVSKCAYKTYVSGNSGFLRCWISQNMLLHHVYLGFKLDRAHSGQFWNTQIWYYKEWLNRYRICSFIVIPSENAYSKLLLYYGLCATITYRWKKKSKTSKKGTLKQIMEQIRRVVPILTFGWLKPFCYLRRGTMDLVCQSWVYVAIHFQNWAAISQKWNTLFHVLFLFQIWWYETQFISFKVPFFRSRT